jgi:hypothetical protein
MVVAPGAIALLARWAGVYIWEPADEVAASAAGMGAVLAPSAGLLLLLPPEQPAAVAIATTSADGRARRCMRGRDMVGSFRWSVVIDYSSLQPATAPVNGQ